MSEPLHPIARLAWEAIHAYVERDEILDPPTELPPELTESGGAFVSIKKEGELRGCIGTVEAVKSTRAEEIIRNAIHAATMDPRFPPVEASELESLDVSVDILCDPEPVEDSTLLDPSRYGIIVKKGERRALLLPDIEGVDTTEKQVTLARRKAGIEPEEPVELARFETKRYY
jgi:AmmeMemoRadiSam system protein A